MDSPEQQLALIDAIARRHVAVIGDIVADEFVYGRVARISREAPVLILDHDSTQFVAGGAGNAANNVAALGGRARLVGVVGRDEAGRRVTAGLLPGVDRRRIVRSAFRETPMKTRILAGGIHSAKQQVVRIDRVSHVPIDRTTRAQFEAAAIEVAADCDALLISDYGSGLITPAFAQRLRAASRAAGPVPVSLDSRHAVSRYRGLTLCAPNEDEVAQATGIRIGDDLRALERAGREILTGTRMGAVLVTRGSRGMALFQPNVPTVHIPIFGSDEIADVTGAGDTVIATVTLALAAGATFERAARLANYAGGLVVMKRGTATVSADELRDAVRSERARPSRRGARARG